MAFFNNYYSVLHTLISFPGALFVSGTCYELFSRRVFINRRLLLSRVMYLSAAEPPASK